MDRPTERPTDRLSEQASERATDRQTHTHRHTVTQSQTQTQRYRDSEPDTRDTERDRDRGTEIQTEESKYRLKAHHPQFWLGTTLLYPFSTAEAPFLAKSGFNCFGNTKMKRSVSAVVFAKHKERLVA